MRYFVFLLVIFFSTNSTAKLIDGGTKYYENYNKANAACMSLASSMGGLHPYCLTNQGKRYFEYSVNSATQTRYYFLNHGSGCPSGTTTDATGLCSEPKVCPEKGTFFNGIVDVDAPADGRLNLVVGNSASKDGCVVKFMARTVDCDFAPSGSLGCKSFTDYAYTGLAVGEESDIPKLEDGSPQIDTPIGEPISDGDHTKDTIIEIFGDFVTTDLADGTTVTSKVDIVTETNGAGLKISTAADSKTLTRSDGVSKTITTTTTTTTSPNGAKTVQTKTHTNYSQNDNSIVSVITDTGRVSYSNAGAFSGDQTTNKTETYSPSGDLTSSNSETTGDIGEEVAEETESKTFCEENKDHLDCKEYDAPPDGGIYTAGDKTFSGVFSDFANDIKNSDLVSLPSNYFNITTSASCPRWSADLGFYTAVIDQQCSSAFAIILVIIKSIILATASFYAFRVAIL